MYRNCKHILLNEELLDSVEIIIKRSLIPLVIPQKEMQMCLQTVVFYKKFTFYLTEYLMTFALGYYFIFTLASALIEAG